MGGGGQGATHLVKSKQTEKLAVLKTLKNADCPQARKRMRLEVVSLQTLADYGARVPRPLHDNLESVDQIDVPLFFVMEHVEGRTLDRVITEDGTLELLRAIEVVEQMSETIAIGHREKLIHRDLKPKNVILGSDTNGQSIATVLDYGISFNNQHDDGLTRTQENFWNEFLSLPETNVEGNDRRDFRTDVTALCGLFFYCLTGRAPQLLLDGQGKLPHQRAGVEFAGVEPNSDVAALLQAFFNRGFRPRVNDRFQSVEDLLKQLDIIRKCATSDRDSITGAASRNSELLRMHDRTTQLVRIKEKVAKQRKALERAIEVLLK
jgi:serine/threonine-protein kinase